MLNPDNLFMAIPGLYGDKVELMVVADERPDVDINTEIDWVIAEETFKRLM